MSDSVQLDGKEYISSKRASELSGYAQDYIGQLARKGLIDAQRVGGLWHISMESLSAYKTQADTYVPSQPERKQQVEVDSLISFDGKDHVSAARAAQITGYHPDYVGQLARSGAIISRQVGNRWYIDREGILAHKSEKDSLLGAVQAQSVGIVRNKQEETSDAPETSYNGAGPFLTYTQDNGDLIPVLSGSKATPQAQKFELDPVSIEEYAVPIHTVRTPTSHHFATQKRSKIQSHAKIRTSGKTIFYSTFGKVAAAALTIVIVLSFGFVTLKNSSVYGTNVKQGGSVIQRNGLTAGAAEALHRIRDILGNLFVSELVYKRVK